MNNLENTPNRIKSQKLTADQMTVMITLIFLDEPANSLLNNISTKIIFRKIN